VQKLTKDFQKFQNEMTSPFVGTLSDGNSSLMNKKSSGNL
jgi:hypothetical protein